MPRKLPHARLRREGVSYNYIWAPLMMDPEISGKHSGRATLDDCVFVRIERLQGAVASIEGTGL